MNRPTILDLDLVIVPREATQVMPFSDKTMRDTYTAMLSASPYHTAWDEVRKYVEGLERERDDMRLSSQHSADWASQAITDMKAASARAEAAEARIAELEAEVERLADLYGNEEKPRYTTRRLRIEVERAKAAAGIRIAELEKLLADAEREPKDEVDEGQHQFVADWYRPARCQACGGLRDHPLHRAARAYMEGK